MDLSWIMMFLASIVLMIVVFLVYFSIRASQQYHDLSSNFSRIIKGSIVAGGGAGIILGFLLWCVLPTHHYITSQSSNDGYYTRYVIDENLFNEYGRTYLVNLSASDCYLAAMEYNSKITLALFGHQPKIITIPVGYIVEEEHEVDGWFEPFPMTISTKNKGGDTRWHVLSKSMLISEYEKIGIHLTQE